jgi:hypothetical protein
LEKCSGAFFDEAACQELAADGVRPTQSALSLLSGVFRKVSGRWTQ